MHLLYMCTLTSRDSTVNITKGKYGASTAVHHHTIGFFHTESHISTQILFGEEAEILCLCFSAIANAQV